MNTVIRICLTGVALVAAAAATAGSLPDIKVQYSARELASPAGMAALQRRLTAAAEQQCEQLNGRELARKEAYHNCVDQLVTGALREVQAHNPAQPVRLAAESRSAGSQTR